MRRSFTVFELLVMLAIIAIVVSISLGALRTARQRASDVDNLSCLRQFSFALAMYSADNRAAFPYFAIPGDPESPRQLLGGRISDAAGGYFWRQSALWASLVVPYLTGEPTVEMSPVLERPFQNHSAIWCRYFMTCTAFASPEYWNPAHDPLDLTMLRGTRISQMRYPARKGVLLDMFGGYLHPFGGAARPVFVAFGDGAVAAKRYEHATQPVDRPFSALPLAILSTPDGIAGKDF